MLEESETSAQKRIDEVNAERYLYLTDAHFKKHGMSSKYDDFVLRLRRKLDVGNPNPGVSNLEAANKKAWEKRKLNMVKSS